MNDRDRIELIMKSYGLTPSQFADRAGVQRASVSHILSGRNKPSLEVMLKIFEAFPGLDMQWLMTGKGVAPTGAPIEEEPAGPVQPSKPVQSELFPPTRPVVNDVLVASAQKNEQPRALPAERQARRASRVAASTPPPVVKKIKEIRVFYTDGTYETMFPEK